MGNFGNIFLSHKKTANPVDLKLSLHNCPSLRYILMLTISFYMLWLASLTQVFEGRYKWVMLSCHTPGEYLSSMNRREPSKAMSDKWFYNFLKRWPEISVKKPSGLEMIRARSSIPEIIEKYYVELSTILEKYDLMGRPKCIYNVDEKGINSEHNPPQYCRWPKFLTTI